MSWLSDAIDSVSSRLRSTFEHTLAFVGIDSISADSISNLSEKIGDYVKDAPALASDLSRLAAYSNPLTAFAAAPLYAVTDKAGLTSTGGGTLGKLVGNIGTTITKAELQGAPVAGAVVGGIFGGTAGATLGLKAGGIVQGLGSEITGVSPSGLGFNTADPLGELLKATVGKLLPKSQSPGVTGGGYFQQAGEDFVNALEGVNVTEIALIAVAGLVVVLVIALATRG